jgi:hypothetical protein
VLKAHKEHLNQPAIKIRLTVVLRPPNDKYVVLVRAVCAAECLPVRGPPGRIRERRGAPVQRTRHDVAARGDAVDGVIVAIAAHLVDLAAARPGALGAELRVDPRVRQQVQ